MQPVRPMLKPALRRVWRDRSTLQLGLDPARAVVITGIDPAWGRLVERLDGTADLTSLQQTAAQLGLPPLALDGLLRLLERSGALEEGDAGDRAFTALPRDERDRLAPDVAAASLARAGPGGASVLARRRRARVTVIGAGRVGAGVVSLLAAAGVGTVVVDDTATTTPADLAPGGLAHDQVGAARQDAAARRARQVAPAVRTSPGPRPRPPDLVVLATDAPLPDPAEGERWVRSGTTHLYAGVRDTVGVVGPLVLPGRSSCARCHDLHRRDRDPAWPAVAAQLTDGRPGVLACDVALAAAVAAHAVLHALAVLDGAEPPPSLNGTVEIAQADATVRRRSWSPHVACGCTWPQPVRPPPSAS